MTSFTSLLSSIGGGQPKAPQPKSTGASSSAPRTPGSARPPMQSSSARPTPNNMAAGVKRKPEDTSGPPQSKTVRTEVKVPVQPPSQGSSNLSNTAKPVPVSNSATAGYRGTARPSNSTQQAKPAVKAAPATAARPSQAAASIAAPAANGAPKPKRGFAAIMEKAKAAEEAAKAAGSSTIKHKTVDKMSKRERERAQQAAAGNQQPGAKGGKISAVADRSRSGTPNDGRPGLQKKVPVVGYKGTMKKPAKPMPEIAYKGTMRKAAPGEQLAKRAAVKGQPQDKYGGYASWSDLSDAEDEEEGYDSEGSSMMEAGLDDVEAEETMALRAARREDQEALQEEERLKREKLERKKRLMALNKTAATKKKY